MRAASFSSFTNFSAAISLMSTSHAGRKRRIAIIGTRLWPPATSFAPSPWRASSSQASPTEAARAYSKDAAFTFYTLSGPSSQGSIGSRSRDLDDLAPLRGLRSDEFCEFLRRVRHHGQSQAFKTLGDSGRAKRFGEFGVQIVDHGLGRCRRGRKAVPHAHLEPGKAGLVCRRYFGRLGMTRF